jgi:hypothetical protein
MGRTVVPNCQKPAKNKFNLSDFTSYRVRLDNLL